MNSKMKSLGLAALLLAVPAISMAGSVTGTGLATGSFDVFAATILGWLKGGLGIGIALVGLIVGATLGISNGTAFPMIVGVLIAAGFAFLPSILDEMVDAANAAILPVAQGLAPLVGG